MLAGRYDLAHRKTQNGLFKFEGQYKQRAASISPYKIEGADLRRVQKLTGVLTSIENRVTLFPI
jgi:hypothetical protein